jgi:error-prone DNA polymerase
VDPARIEVLFERFISKERHEPPNIDVDFERGPLSRLVSIDNAAMGGRTVIRPAGRCRHRGTAPARRDARAPRPRADVAQTHRG